ncbi:MAG TPA: DUF1810 domain-containing protein [Flavisolibacter sp.]|jgi:uncharacterized protein (DUF1810 family)|nr:DUF1810 domain-containing protein [Flavisolibacter sp.]
MEQATNLDRFIKAQENVYKDALSEIKGGRKRSHWMWYIFPQIAGLGFSETSMYYGIKNLSEAEAYARHPVLGSRLVEICTALLGLAENNANRIFGSPDDMKLKSSMTLFSSLSNGDPVFEQVLNKFYNGSKDQRTLELL